MSAVLRLNLLITAVFSVALVWSVQNLILQASKDIEREVVAGLSFTHKVLAVAAEEPSLLSPFLNGYTRHVNITLLPPGQLEAPKVASYTDEQVPRWFLSRIPGIEQFSDRRLLRFLPDGRALLVEADPSDEVAEVWESVQQTVSLFILAALLTNVAVWLGVRQGVKPLGQLLAGLSSIREGRLEARLPTFSLPELNQLAGDFNNMAEQLQREQQGNRALTRQLMRLQEAERSHLARELHDDLGQYVAGIQAQAYLITRTSSLERQTQAAHAIVKHCQTMQQSFRCLIQALHPVVLDQMALSDALLELTQQWQQQHGVTCHCDMSYLPTLEDEYNSHIYRFVQESLNNVAKHAKATEVFVMVGCHAGQLKICVVDNGIGCHVTDTKGFGMRSMQERAHMMGGELTVVSQPNKGLSLSLNVPLKEVT